MPISRRDFLRAGAATGLVAATRPWQLIDAYANVAATPPFDHVVVVMMENRSFDHFFGGLPGVDGAQAGLVFANRRGTEYPTYDLGDDYQGCGYSDPDHSYHGFVAEYNGGRMDGWLRTPVAAASALDDTFPIGYYRPAALPVLSSLARAYTISDHYFSSIMAETYPNRFYQHSGTTDRDVNTSTTSTLPTIWDRLAAASLTGRYYSSDAPFLALWGTRYLGITQPVSQFLVDCQAGTLPNVAYVDPAFAGEGQGISRDDHPHADVRAGEFFLGEIYNAVRNSPQWDRTVMVVNFDEWGGFYDHVRPPQVADGTTLSATGANHDQLGFRVPNVVISPFAPAGRVVSGGQPFDHTSVLRMIEWRWNLAPLQRRDAMARNLADMLDFRVARTDIPVIGAEPATHATGTACGAGSTAASPPAPVGGPGSTPAPGAPVTGTGATGSVGGSTPNTAAAATGDLAAMSAAATLTVAAARARYTRRPAAAQ